MSIFQTIKPPNADVVRGHNALDDDALSVAAARAQQRARAPGPQSRGQLWQLHHRRLHETHPETEQILQPAHPGHFGERPRRCAGQDTPILGHGPGLYRPVSQPCRVAHVRLEYHHRRV